MWTLWTLWTLCTPDMATTTRSVPFATARSLTGLFCFAECLAVGFVRFPEGDERIAQVLGEIIAPGYQVNNGKGQDGKGREGTGIAAVPARQVAPNARAVARAVARGSCGSGARLSPVGGGVRGREASVRMPLVTVIFRKTRVWLVDVAGHVGGLVEATRCCR